MAENLNLGDSCCCRPAVSGLRKLTFPDGSQVGIIGLDAVLEDLYHQGKPADSMIGVEIIERLKSQNYFSDSYRKQYEELFKVEYQRFLNVKLKSKEKENDTMDIQDNTQNTRKKGLFGFLKGDKKAANEGSCCNMKIVPKDQAAKEPNQGCCCNVKIVPKEQAAKEPNQGCCCNVKIVPKEQAAEDQTAKK